MVTALVQRLLDVKENITLIRIIIFEAITSDEFCKHSNSSLSSAISGINQQTFFDWKESGTI